MQKKPALLRRHFFATQYFPGISFLWRQRDRIFYNIISTQHNRAPKWTGIEGGVIMFDLIPSKRNRGLAKQDDVVDFISKRM